MGCNVSKDVKVDDQGNVENATNGGNKPDMSEEKAAEKIQASFRGYKTRKSLKNNGVLPAEEGMTPKQTKGEVEEKTVKEKTIENSSKETPKPKSAESNDLDDILNIDLTDVELEKAATKIQASYRNFTKKKVETANPSGNSKTKEEEAKEDKEKAANNDKETEDGLEDIDLEDPEVEKAALKIQSTFRGYKNRRVNAEGPIENGEKGENKE